MNIDAAALETNGRTRQLKYSVYVQPSDVATEYWVKAWSGSQVKDARVVTSRSIRKGSLFDEEHKASRNLCESRDLDKEPEYNPRSFRSAQNPSPLIEDEDENITAASLQSSPEVPGKLLLLLTLE